MKFPLSIKSIENGNFFVSLRTIWLLFCFLFVNYSYLWAQTTVSKEEDNWILKIDGTPFEVKGVTFGPVDDIENYQKYFDDLKFLGVNTIRIWATNDNTKTLLDKADQYNMKVMVGIWMRHGRPGREDDDSFNYLKDDQGMRAMYDNAIQRVTELKDHPAVLTWALGNEVYLNTATDKEKIAYSKLLERIAGDIKKVDPNHPITSVEAWVFGVDWWEEYVPSIDIYGLNSYGEGANYLSSELKNRGVDKPYIVTEFGVTGEWDIKTKTLGIIDEPNDQKKYEAIVKGYNEWIKPKNNCLGVYIFHYSDGDNFVSPWLLTRHQGKTRPQYWAIREAYTGESPINHVPVIREFELQNESGNSASWIPVSLDVNDREGEELNVSFYYNQRTGSRKRRDQILPITHRGDLGKGFEIQLPKEDGPIKVYVNITDSFNNVGIASTAIRVSDKDASERKFLVPKGNLPFVVYKDGNKKQPYVPTGYMGNYNDLEINTNYRDDNYSGNSCIEIKYKSKGDWYGIGFVDPANDWGNILGGYDLSGATSFSFWAKSSVSNTKATIGFGLIDNDKTYYDTAKKSIEIQLTSEWKKYTIKTKRLDMSCIRSGFVLVSSGQGLTHEIYIDDIIFE